MKVRLLNVSDISNMHIGSNEFYGIPKCGHNNYLKGPHTIKKSVNMLKQKIGIKILSGFLTVCGRFFCQKIHWLKILTDQICLIYFDQSLIFWQLFNILTHVWALVKILIKISVPGEHLVKTRATATAASGSNIFNAINFYGTCVGNIDVKNLIKNWTSIFCFKILTVFLIVYGAL